MRITLVSFNPVRPKPQPTLSGAHYDSSTFVISEYDAEHGALLARNPYHAEFGQRVTFLAASKQPHGLTAELPARGGA